MKLFICDYTHACKIAKDRDCPHSKQHEYTDACEIALGLQCLDSSCKPCDAITEINKEELNDNT